MLAFPQSGFCADNTTDFGYMLEGEIVAYKKGDYPMAYSCGNFALKLNPNNATARYFLALSLAKLNRKEEAIEQYKHAAACTRDRKLLSYIQLGLNQLTPPKETATKSATTKAATPVTPSTPEEKPTVVTKELSAAKQQALAEAKNEIEVRRKEADRAIAKIHDEEAAQLAGVEQYQFKETDSNGKTDKVYEQTAAYTALFEKLKQANEKSISDINERFEKEKARIEAASKLRVDAYQSSATGEKTQLKMGNGLTQVMPIGSNMYVRNIINYGSDNRPPELKGKMQGLDDKMTPAPTNNPRTAGSK
ncbi:unnamed protein product [Sphagnum balticum]